MSNILEYKGYYAKIEYSAEDQVLYGKIEGINDLVNFESTSPTQIQQEFEQAVDGYLDFCKEIGKSPDKVYRGLFNVRIAPDLHRELSHLAFKTDQTLNQVVEKAIRCYVLNPLSK